MYEHIKDIKIPSTETIKSLLEPIYNKLDKIDIQLFTQYLDNNIPKYYRNSDLKEIFNLSNNTIVKYRETGILPYTKLGDIYLYDVKAINAILKQNSVKF
jgi:hypothetical protein